ncbi:MAG: glycosyltransferase family 4 protein [Anaerolineaceae bacterium]|nr:glycosyltransferase family 4 protein [Anaerolineaceae bacterium]MBN2678463.1 glycosyltransferase family 4 protein [Anaerolineaceae bacterium]
MHILLIHQAFSTLDEAGGTRHVELAQYLVEHGHQVTVIASPISYLTGKLVTRHQRSHKSQPHSNLSIHRCYTYNALHKSYVHRVFGFMSFMVTSFITALQVRSVDIVWGTSPPIFQGATAWLVARLKGASFLFEVRDLWPAFAVAVGVLRNRLLITASEWLEGFLYRHADRVVVNSPGFIEHVKTHGAKDVTLLPNSVDIAMFVSRAEPEVYREKLGLQDQFVVLYAGAHGLSNDLEVVLDAADILREDKTIRFLLVGDGKEKPKLIARAEQQKLANVMFMPSQPKKAIPDILSMADACLAILKPLDLYKTTYPNKVFDYMAAAKPVILAIDGVIRQVVEAAGGGVFVKPGNPRALAACVKNLADNPAQARGMGQAGYRYVRKHFNRQDIAGQFSGFIESMRKHGRKDIGG